MVPIRGCSSTQEPARYPLIADVVPLAWFFELAQNCLRHAAVHKKQGTLVCSHTSVTPFDGIQQPAHSQPRPPRALFEPVTLDLQCRLLAPDQLSIIQEGHLSASSPCMRREQWTPDGRSPASWHKANFTEGRNYNSTDFGYCPAMAPSCQPRRRLREWDSTR